MGSVVERGEATYSVADSVSWGNKTLCGPLIKLALLIFILLI